MKRTLLSACCLLTALISPAYCAAEDLSKGWLVDGFFGMNGFLSGAQNSRHGEGEIYSASAFGDLRAVFDYSIVYWDFRLRAEYGMIKPLGEKIRKGADEFDLDAYHVWQVHDWVNPYIRVSFDSRFTAGHDFFRNPEDLHITYRKGRSETRTTTQLRIHESFNPTYFGEGMGAYFTALGQPDKVVGVMVGVAGRQLAAANYLVEQDIRSTSAIEYREIGNYAEWGGEVIVDSRFRPLDQLLISSTLDVFYSFDGDLLVEWNADVSYQIWKILYLRGMLDANYNERVVSKTQWRQGLMLSLAFQVGNK